MGNLGVTIDSESATTLFAGEFPRVEMPITVASGQGSLARGTVLGVITANSKLGAYLNTNADGTETARCILGETVDATAADVKTYAYYTGEFNEAALAGIDSAGKADLIDKSIFVKTVK